MLSIDTTQIERPHNPRRRQSVGTVRQNRFEAWVMLQCGRLLLEHVEANFLKLRELSRSFERHIPAGMPNRRLSRADLPSSYNRRGQTHRRGDMEFYSVSFRRSCETRTPVPSLPRRRRSHNPEFRR